MLHLLVAAPQRNHEVNTRRACLITAPSWIWSSRARRCSRASVPREMDGNVMTMDGGVPTFDLESIEDDTTTTAGRRIEVSWSIASPCSGMRCRGTDRASTCCRAVPEWSVDAERAGFPRFDPVAPLHLDGYGRRRYKQPLTSPRGGAAW